MEDFKEQLNNFFIQHPYLFTEYVLNSETYFGHFFPKGFVSFKFSLIIDANLFIEDYKDKVVQTYQVVSNDNIVISSLFQISAEEHLLILYTQHLGKLAGYVNMYSKNSSRIPFWIESLKAYEVKEEKRKLGFGQST